MYSETHDVTLTKLTKRSLQATVIGSNLENLDRSVIGTNLKRRGWSMTPASDPAWIRLDSEDADRPNLYTIGLKFTFSREDGKTPEAHEFPAILKKLAKRAATPNYGSWIVTYVDGAAYEIPENTRPDDEDQIGYSEVEIPEDFEDEFNHLYGLGSHVARIKAAIEAGQMSGWMNRYHVALIGPPGCGKSDICQSLKRALGDEAVMEYDATATTGAGAIEDLASRVTLPRILVVEEIEKADPKALAFLLAVCDMRGEIRKTTARGRIERDTKLLVICTVNDVDLFSSLQAGALASRFANKIWFKRPTREMLGRILDREIDKVNGDREWAKPTLDYCADPANDIADPRMVTALCLCGRDMWLTDEYATILAETAPTEAAGKAAISK